MAGQVTSTATGGAVAGAEVSVGNVRVETDLAGRFALRFVPDGPASLRVVAAGFEHFETRITVANGRATRDVQLTRIETFAIDDFALYVPKTVDHPTGLLVALGGPDTRAFATGAPAGAPIPEVEAALQILGQDFRRLAGERRLAILGTSLAGMANASTSDSLIQDVLLRAAESSGRPELASAPVLFYGIASGAPEASGFAARNPAHVAGLFLKVPASVETLTGGEALKVPTYVVLAGQDAIVDNAATAAAFAANRNAGALWALVTEPGVPHHSLTARHRYVTLDWMRTIALLRLVNIASSGTWEPMPGIDAELGWLGDPATGMAWTWTAYPADRGSASWLPSQLTAREWQLFRAPAGAFAGISGVYDLTARVEWSDPGWTFPGTAYEVGAVWAGTLTIEQPADSSRFTGRYSDFRFTAPNGQQVGGPLDVGPVTGSVDSPGHVVFDFFFGENLEPDYHGVGMADDSTIVGTLTESSGTRLTFTAVRRPTVAARRVR